MPPRIETDDWLDERNARREGEYLVFTKPDGRELRVHQNVGKAVQSMVAGFRYIANPAARQTMGVRSRGRGPERRSRRVTRRTSRNKSPSGSDGEPGPPPRRVTDRGRR